MIGRDLVHGWQRRVSLGFSLLLGALCLIWPYGWGGRMPVGGDVTQFSIGLMGVLHRAVRSARWPLWNDLWGYGFPGLAESQMGVYYPPHGLLYGLCSTEVAYTASLVVHVIWASVGAAWAAGRFGAGSAGRFVSGFVFAGCGFFAIHLSHQWAYTVGSWMPWAWGLAWGILHEGRGRRWVMGLAAVLAVQVLPGHFQLAFQTQVGILILVTASLLDRERPRGAVGRACGVLLSLSLVLPLTMMQIWPTWVLARLAESDRTLEYLSGFAATPVHLISYVTPGLFHRSPLWRPVAWDPFHTSPEEHLGYVGVAPLFLALGAVARGIRRDASIRALAFVVTLSIFLSLGPHVPGFGWLIHLPGFSFFRAPARWGLATMLALGLLAGIGFDRLGEWEHARARLARFAILAAIPPLVLVVGFEMALASTSGPGWDPLADAFEAGRRTLPWEGDPNFRAVMAEARRPSRNPIVVAALKRRGLEPTARLDRERSRVYVEELGETVAILSAVLILSAVAANVRWLRRGLIGLTVVDLLLLASHRDLESAPIAPLERQSPVLARLAELPVGSRSLDGLGNLPMLPGAAPLRAYRTLDLPALRPLNELAAADPSQGLDPSVIAKAARVAGAEVRIEPAGPVGTALPGWGDRDVISDPALAGWNVGRAWIDRHPGEERFAIRRVEEEPPRAWLVRSGLETLGRFREAGELLAAALALADAEGLVARSDVPERLDLEEFEVEVDGPWTVVLSRLHHPEWRGEWIDPAGRIQPAEVRLVFSTGGAGGWQGVSVPGPGRWRLHLWYEGRAERQGLMVSAIAWTAWLVAFAWPSGRRPQDPADKPVAVGEQTS